MTTLPAPELKKFDENSIESKVYTFIDTLDEYIVTPNDRYRMSYGVIKFLEGDGDAPEVLVHSTKVNITGISADDLAAKIAEGISNFK